MMKRWLGPYGITAIHERVHTIADLEYFIRREGGNVNTRFVHIIGHGVNEPSFGTACLHLTFERLYLAKNAEVFAGLGGKILIFSRCEVGADWRALEAIRAASGAAAVIAYRVVVVDSFINLAEALLYQFFLNTFYSPQSVVKRVNNLMNKMDALTGDHITRKSVVVCV